MGFRISKSKIYRDKDKGQIRVNPDGSVPETEVRAVVLESGFRHLFNVKASEWIALVGGNVGKTADFLQSLNAGLDQQLNSYANIKTFQVMFEEN